MFTGIIDGIGRIHARRHAPGADLRLVVACGYEPATLTLGASIACNGACMTVVESGRLNDDTPFFSVDVSSESVSRTAPGQWHEDKPLNLERSLRLGDPLDGGLITGHVDDVARIVAITSENGSHRLEIAPPPALLKYIAAKGTVALDGVALTVNAVSARGFSVNIIPHTWQVTTLGERQAGDSLNLEIDLIARYVERLMAKEI